MAKTEYEILRGTFREGAGLKAETKGPGDTIRMDAAEAGKFVAAGSLIEAGSRPRPGKSGSKADAAQLAGMEAALAAANAQIAELQAETGAQQAVIARLRDLDADSVDLVIAEIAAGEGEGSGDDDPKTDGEA